MSELKAYISMLESRVRLDPTDRISIKSLVDALDAQTDTSARVGAYSALQSYIAELTTIEDLTKSLNDLTKFTNYIKKLISIIDHSNLNLSYASLQSVRGQTHKINGTIAHCEMRLKLFNEHEVISSLCHDCFKVQILTDSVDNLIRLYIVLWISQFPSNNSRKTMVELRPAVPYPYKGYIYCQSEEEAISCKNIITFQMQRFGINFSDINITHGCSEYSLKYPSFKYDDDGNYKNQKYPSNWKIIEKEFFENNHTNSALASTNDASVVTLRDVTTFRTYIDYAELIGDKSAELFRTSPSTNKPEPFATRVWQQSPQRRKELNQLTSK